MYRKRLSAWSIVGLLIAVLVTGCSGLALPGAKKAITDKVKLQMSWVTSAQHAGFLVAKEKGYYADEGIDVEIVPGGPSTSPVQQVAGGVAQFGLGDYPEIMGARAEGVPVKAIGHVYHNGPLRMVSFKKNNIKTPADFKGHTIGVWFGGNEYEFFALMEKFGLDWKKDMTVIQQGYTMDPLISGELDVAMAMTYSELISLYDSGIKAADLNLIDLRDYGTSMASQVIFAQEAWLTKNNDLAVRFMRASIKGWQEAIKNRPDAVQNSMKYVEAGVTNVAQQTQTLDETANLVLVAGMGMTANDDVPGSFTTAIWEAATGRKTPTFKH
jgi:NitT/TauT family transport system substrate-binding protein